MPSACDCVATATSPEDAATSESDGGKNTTRVVSTATDNAVFPKCALTPQNGTENKATAGVGPRNAPDCKQKSVSRVWAIAEAECGDWEILTVRPHPGERGPRRGETDFGENVGTGPRVGVTGRRGGYDYFKRASSSPSRGDSGPGRGLR